MRSAAWRVRSATRWRAAIVRVAPALVGGLVAGVAPSVPAARSPRTRPAAVARATARQPLDIELRSAARTLVPGETVAVAIRLRPNPGWHTYWRYAGDVGSAPSVAWRLPDGFTVTPLRWPAPVLIASPPLASYGYDRELHLLAAVHVPRTARVGSRVTLAGTVSWVACKVECVAGDVALALTLPVAATTAVDSTAARAFAAAAHSVPERRRDWVFRAAVDSLDSSTMVLRIHPPREQWALRDVAVARVHFFVDSADVLDHAAPLQARVDTEGLELRLHRSPYASRPPSRLTGVLTLDGVGASRLAIEVVAPVVGMAQLTALRGPVGPPAEVAVPRDTSSWLALATAGLLALLGGTLLNLMPCVLPVLSIKAFGFAEAAAQDARTARRHALLFGAGVLVSMWTLVGLLLALRAVGTEVGWGYQLQSPTVVGVLALFMFAAALNMVGVFELTPIGGGLAAARRTPPAVEAFVSGVLVTTLATPCSAPFLAAAVAFGIAGGPASAFVVFTTLGLGLVWPLALVTASPRVRGWLPAPGEWMVTLRQALAFPLFATVVWLAWVRGRQAGADAVTTLLAALIVLAFGLWVLGRFGTLVASVRRRRVAYAFAFVMGAGALALVLAEASAPGATGPRTRPTAGAPGTPMRPAADADALPWGDTGVDTVAIDGAAEARRPEPAH